MSDFKNYKYLIVRESNFKLEIILNRPDKKNAINSEMLKELMGCTNYANENDSVRAVVYKSTGDVFFSVQNLLRRLRAPGGRRKGNGPIP